LDKLNATRLQQAREHKCFRSLEETRSISSGSAPARHSCILTPKSEDEIDEAKPREITLRSLFSSKILAEPETVVSCAKGVFVEVCIERMSELEICVYETIGYEAVRKTEGIVGSEN
jgi:hypothetical protein